MRLRFEGARVLFYKDTATNRCCGESRSNWELVGETSIERLVKALQNFVLGKSKIENV